MRCVDENGACENARPNDDGEMCEPCQKFYAICEECGEIWGNGKHEIKERICHLAEAYAASR